MTAAATLRPADWRSGAPGAYAPTPGQLAIIEASRALARLNIRFRHSAVGWTQRLRPGPIDYELLGLQMRFCPHLNFRDGAALLSEATFDRRDRAFVVAHLPQDGVFLDIGANMGIYSLTVASRRPDARAYAFEPIADVAARLQFNVAANGLDSRLFVRATALGDTTGTLRFSLNSESAVLGAGEVTVPCDTLLNVVRAEALTRIDCIKIDVEGYEDRVLFPFFAAAPEALWPRHVIIEHIMPDVWERNCIELLKERGYRAVWQSGFNTAFER